MVHRKPTSLELKLMSHLITDSGNKTLEDQLVDLEVENMSDGGMGSLKLFPRISNNNYGERLFGGNVAEIEFNGLDGILVSAALYLDKEGNDFELDVWKVDFSELKQLPTSY